MRGKTRNISKSALFAALIFVATRFIQIPMGPIGYVNVGDGLVILAGWMLSPVYAFLAAGVGSAFADVLSPYIVYAPATFVIKGLMAIIACFIFKAFKNNKKTVISALVGGAVAESVMIGGYLLYEGFLYGFKTALLSVPFNSIQGLIALIAGTVLIKLLEKRKFIS